MERGAALAWVGLRWGEGVKILCAKLALPDLKAKLKSQDISCPGIWLDKPQAIFLFPPAYINPLLFTQKNWLFGPVKIC